MQAYEVILQKVFPNIAERVKNKEQLRIWITACSTGEEAYSVAMILDDFYQGKDKVPDIKIFASDIDDEAISFASAGIYTIEDVSPVPERYLQKYFQLVQGKYKVRDNIRNKIVFARQNLISNPPFINMDLITCRNVLIYLEPHIQKKLLINFQFSLKPGGFLWMGPSESIYDIGAELEVISNKWRVYQSKPDTNRPLPNIGPYQNINKLRSSLSHSSGALITPAQPNRLREDYFKKILINEYAPNCIFINKNFEILYLTGQANKFLTLPALQTQMNLLNMVDETLALILRNGIRQLMTEEKPVIIKNIRLHVYEKPVSADLTLKYHDDPKHQLQSILIEISEIPEGEENVIILQDVKEDTVRDKHIRQLEAELVLARQDLQATVEELETSNEELQASNEELLASNEELQSTNEELRSVNEELHTVNGEFQLRNQQLADVNSDIENFLNSTGLGTIFLDERFCIRRFTPAILEQFNIEESDVGRPLIPLHSQFRIQGSDRGC